MLGEEDWTSERSTSASCVEEAAAGGRVYPPQQQQEQVLHAVVQQGQHGQMRLSTLQEQQQRSRTHEEHLLFVQDEQLDVLETTVGNLKDIGLQIGEEIDGHQQLLGDLDEQVEWTQGALNRNMLLLHKMVERQSTACLCFTAIILFLALLVLLFLAY